MQDLRVFLVHMDFENKAIRVQLGGLDLNRIIKFIYVENPRLLCLIIAISLLTSIWRSKTVQAGEPEQLTQGSSAWSAAGFQTRLSDS